MRRLLTFCFFMTLGGFALAQPIKTETQADTHTSYVWASKLNLRQTPSVQGKVLAELPYGTAVKRLEEAQERVPYAMTYMVNPNDESTEPIVLNGYWQKVKTPEHTGYVFSGLLLDIKPMQQGEGISHYWVRVFNLTQQPKSETREKVAEYDYFLITTTSPYISRDTGVILTLIETRSEPEEKEWAGHGGEITIPQMTFAQAIVFFNALIPPYEEGYSPSYTYKKDKIYRYAMDGPGNRAELTVLDKGVLFSWFDGGD